MKKYIDLPLILTLHKKFTQTFPDNQKVTLYYCETLKKYFTLTYGKDGYELNEENYSIINELKKVSSVSEFNFMDGTVLNINEECAKHVLKLYENISEGQLDFEDYIIKSNKNFLNILKYSVKHGDSLNG